MFYCLLLVIKVVFMKFEFQLRDLFKYRFVVRRDSDGVHVIPLFVGRSYSGKVVPWNSSASRFGVYLNFKSSRAKNCWLRSKCPSYCVVTQNADSEVVLTFDYCYFDSAAKDLRFKHRRSSKCNLVDFSLPTTPFAPEIAKITLGG
jgi:hypothetical protein